MRNGQQGNDCRARRARMVTPRRNSKATKEIQMSDLRSIHWRDIRDTLCGKRMTVHSRLALAGCVTGTELANLMQWQVTSVRPRLTELQQAGLAEPTGERRNGEHVWKWVALATAEARARADQERPANTQQLALFA